MKRLLISALMLSILTTGTKATGPDGCAVVSEPPDGFLNVRKAPTTKSKIITKIHPADLVYIDAYECQFTDACEIDNWIHIANVLRSSGDGKPQALRGWIGKRFIKFIPYGRCNALTKRAF